ncbi:MAG: thiolase domain-containing protein [Candidatus Thermoplasmatota archaeon]|nr:thiolase domain-containing protein [Candidatus Thermoplasmatota archaeon]MCL5888404.1 thiolase domain-containing protein [Candidatus Thermoplasmatota archaeon]
MLSENVYIIGAGEAKYGELWDRSLRDIAVEAGLKAVENAGIRTRDLGAIYMGNSLGGGISMQEHLSALMSDHAGIASEYIPSMRIEASTASGGAAIREGFLAIKSGEYDIVMVGGAEKMTELYGSENIDITSSILDREWEAFEGATPAALAALSSRKYMKDFNVPKEILSKISVNDHMNANLNENAHFRNKITVEQAMKATLIAEPLNLMDCAPLSDGASSIVLASEEYVKKNSIEGVRIVSSAMSQGPFALHSRESVYTVEPTKLAARKALKDANMKNSDISFVEIHDSYNIYGLMALEDLGFAEKGKGKELVEEGIGLNDRLPVNPSGGLKAKGFPFGATGVGQAVEAYLQLKGKANKRQIKDAKRAMIHNMAGSGVASVVHILEVE